MLNCVRRLGHAKNASLTVSACNRLSASAATSRASPIRAQQSTAAVSSKELGTNEPANNKADDFYLNPSAPSAMSSASAGGHGQRGRARAGSQRRNWQTDNQRVFAAKTNRRQVSAQELQKAWPSMRTVAAAVVELNYQIEFSKTGVTFKTIKQIIQFLALQKPVDVSETQVLFFMSCAGDYVQDCTAQQKIHALNELVHIYRQNGYEEGLAQFNLLLRLYNVNHHEFDPKDILALMEQAQVSPTEATLREVVKAYCNKGDMLQAGAVLEHMKAENYTANYDVYNSFLFGYARAGNDAMLEQILKTMSETNVEQTAESNYNLMYGHILNAQWHKAASVHARAEGEQALQHSQYVRLLNALIDGGQQTMQYWNQMVALAEEHLSTHNLWARLIAKLIQHDHQTLAAELYAGLRLDELNEACSTTETPEDMRLFTVLCEILLRYDTPVHKIIDFLQLTDIHGQKLGHLCLASANHFLRYGYGRHEKYDLSILSALAHSGELVNWDTQHVRCANLFLVLEQKLLASRVHLFQACSHQVQQTQDYELLCAVCSLAVEWQVVDRQTTVHQDNPSPQHIIDTKHCQNAVDPKSKLQLIMESEDAAVQTSLLREIDVFKMVPALIQLGVTVDPDTAANMGKVALMSALSKFGTLNNASLEMLMGVLRERVQHADDTQLHSALLHFLREFSTDTTSSVLYVRPDNVLNERMHRLLNDLLALPDGELKTLATNLFSKGFVNATQKMTIRKSIENAGSDQERRELIETARQQMDTDDRRTLSYLLSQYKLVTHWTETDGEVFYEMFCLYIKALGDADADYAYGQPLINQLRVCSAHLNEYRKKGAQGQCAAARIHQILNNISSVCTKHGIDMKQCVSAATMRNMLVTVLAADTLTLSDCIQEWTQILHNNTYPDYQSMSFEQQQSHKRWSNDTTHKLQPLILKVQKADVMMQWIDLLHLFHSRNLIFLNTAAYSMFVKPFLHEGSDLNLLLPVALHFVKTFSRTHHLYDIFSETVKRQDQKFIQKLFDELGGASGDSQTQLITWLCFALIEHNRLPQAQQLWANSIEQYPNSFNHFGNQLQHWVHIMCQNNSLEPVFTYLSIQPIALPNQAHELRPNILNMLAYHHARKENWSEFKKLYEQMKADQMQIRPHLKERYAEMQNITGD